MPPAIEPIPLPPDEGESAARWLESHGLIPRIPPLRSRDYAGLRSCPRTWFLSRALGIAPSLRWSKALVHGSWAHTIFSLVHDPNPLSAFSTVLSARLDELRAACIARGILGDSQLSILTREEHTANTTLAWMLASEDLPAGDGALRAGWLPFIKRYRPVAIEESIPFLWSDPDHPETPCIFQPDLLLLDDSKCLVWIIDFKTCGESTSLRASLCAHEFQTQHYFHGLEHALRDPSFRRAHSLPDNAQVGGVVHLILRKPAIRFGDKDRPYTLDTSPFKSGPRKGEPRNTRVYADGAEPSLTLYRARCRSWFLGTETYLHKADERKTDPCINLSVTPAGYLSLSRCRAEYASRMRFVLGYHGRPLVPASFEAGDLSISHGSASPFLPFILLPVHRWLDVIGQDGFQIHHPDDPTSESSSLTDDSDTDTYTDD